MRAAIITISTSRAAGKGEDESGKALTEFAQGLDADIAGTEILPDDHDQIAQRLRHWCDQEQCVLVLTTGGTGFAPSDVTPEATRSVIEREAPGVAEAMRAAASKHTDHWMLSRAVAGIRGRSLIVNFPGSPKSIRQSAGALQAALPHGLALLEQTPVSPADHGQGDKPASGDGPT